MRLHFQESSRRCLALLSYQMQKRRSIRFDLPPFLFSSLLFSSLLSSNSLSPLFPFNLLHSSLSSMPHTLNESDLCINLDFRHAPDGCFAGEAGKGPTQGRDCRRPGSNRGKPLRPFAGEMRMPTPFLPPPSSLLPPPSSIACPLPILLLRKLILFFAVPFLLLVVATLVTLRLFEDKGRRYTLKP
jgi:hypothetical protein